ncbi:MAG: tetratricopeptide repeat protein [Pirellulaceae bacterium]
MDRPTRASLYLAAWMLVASSGCASWPSSPFRTAAKREASSFESTLSLARLSERHGEATTATRLYEAVIRQDPQNSLAHHRLAVIATKGQQFDKAEIYFEQALADTPDSQLLSDWGYFLYLVDRMPESEAALRQALELDPGNKAAHNNLGLVLGTMGRLDESLAEFRSVGDEAAARANLAYVHALNGAFDQSEREFHQALALNHQLKPAAEALLALHARRDAGMAAALTRTPAPRSNTIEFPPDVAVGRRTLANSLFPPDRTKPAVAHADPAQPQVAAVAFDRENSGPRVEPQVEFESAVKPVAWQPTPPGRGVETSRPLMNLPSPENPSWDAQPSTRTSANREATQTTPGTSPPQSSQVQPWQAPTWTAQ